MRRFSLLAVIAALLLLAPTQVRAEWFADLYGGAGFTQKHDVDNNAPDIGATLTLRDVKFDTEAVLGGRVGYWLDFFHFIGFGLDVSHLFGPDVARQTRTVDVCVSGVCGSGRGTFNNVDLNVTTIGFDAMFRLPLLKSQQFPHGQLQPYLTVGPALFIAHAKDSDNFSPSGQSDTDKSVGVKVGAGATWLFTKNIGVFGEYRFTHFKPEFEFNDAVVGQTTLKTTLDTHSILGGISFRFP